MCSHNTLRSLFIEHKKQINAFDDAKSKFQLCVCECISVPEITLELFQLSFFAGYSLRYVSVGLF